jgi:predicted nucleic acid-binding protein
MVCQIRKKSLGNLPTDREWRPSDRRTCPVSELFGNSCGARRVDGQLLSLPGHEFWPDDLTLFDSRRIHRARLLDSAQVTDSYLLALAATHGGQLTTFDRHLVTDAVVKGPQSLHLIA